MKKVKRVLTVIISLIYIAFLVVCAVSAPVRLQGGESPAPQPALRPAAAPVSAVPTVDFAAGSFPEDATELTLTLQEGETALLDRFAALESADLRGSGNLEEILDWAAEHPDVNVRYSVTLPNGAVLDSDALSADLSGTSAEQAERTLELLGYLPALTTIDLGDAAFSGADIAALRQAFPGAEIQGAMKLMGKDVDPAAETVDLRGLSRGEVSSAAATLALLPELKSVVLGSAAESDLKWEDVAALGEACPNAALDYAFTLWGKDVNLSDEMLDLNHITMDDAGAAVRQVLPYMRNCKVLDMDFCGVSNEDMAVIRDENPNVDVVWRIWFGTDYSVRTNVTSILASKPTKGGTLYNDVGDQLKYCTKVRYLDLGHNFDITDFGFVRYMPDLEIVVISMTGISDLSPFASCEHLKYMEAGNCQLSDLSPLAECKELRHLNVGTNEGVRDITPLYELDLKRLWLGVGDPVPAEQVEEMRRLHPKCEVNTTVPTGLERDANGVQNNQGYVEQYWKCYQQYLKADWDFYANYQVFPNQRPLGWWKVIYKCFQYNLQDQAYAFAWNDPKYDPHEPDVAPVNTRVLNTSFLDEDFDPVKAQDTIIPDKLDDPPGEILYESSY